MINLVEQCEVAVADSVGDVVEIVVDSWVAAEVIVVVFVVDMEEAAIAEGVVCLFVFFFQILKQTVDSAGVI